MGPMAQPHLYKGPDMPPQKDTVYFRDGSRRIDFILAYDDELHSTKAVNDRTKRSEYQARLLKMGLELEMEPKEESVSGRTVFVKVHAPWEPLSIYAEILHVQVPLGENDLGQVSRSDCGPLGCLGKLFRLKPGAVPEQPDYFTAPFRRSQQDVYPITDRDALIPPAVRSQIVHHMLLYCHVSQDSKTTFNLNRMISNGCYTAAYPLHDGEYEHRPEGSEKRSDRKTLWREWARAGRSFKEQPLDLVRSYFGEQVGLYFAWLGFYTKMLSIAAVVGLVCFFVGAFNKDNNITSEEICNSFSEILVMCPQCDKRCTFWRLNETCDSAQSSSIYENPATVFFTLFMGLWATVFLEIWRRYQTALAFRWDLTEEEGDPIRPEYEARCTSKKLNIVTMEEEPHVPRRTLRLRYCFSGVMVLFWILLIIAGILGVVVYRLSVFSCLSSSMPKRVSEIKVIGWLLTPDMVASITASVLNIVVIVLLNIGYDKMAIILTDLEMPRTQREYEYRLTFKKFLFQFVNYYSSCFYIAFLKGKFVGYPGDYAYFRKWRIEECPPAGCLFELTSQLTAVMGMKQIIGNVQEVIVPWFSSWLAKCRAKKGPQNVHTRWEQDMGLQPQSSLGLFDEYLEMVIQFGFVTLFVASFPLAPLLALLNNIVEVRVDAWKFVTKMRRPVVSRASGIGAWADILGIVATLSVMTNACIVAFTSDIIPRLLHHYGYSAGHGEGSPTVHRYTENSLSIFNISNLQERSRPDNLPPWFDPAIHTVCRYRGYRYPPDHPQAYSVTTLYWHILAAKLAFVIVVEHLIFFTKAFIAHVIPDTPSHVHACARRERFIVREILRRAELRRLRNSFSSSSASPMMADMGLLHRPPHTDI
ncbi:anoctamin-6-like [Lampetra planeri]